MKKILHISKFYPPYYGGIEDVAHTLVCELKPYFKQQVLCYNHEHGTITEEMDGIPIHRVGTLCQVASQPLAPQYLKKLHTLIRKFQPDYIHVHLPNPMVCFYLLLLGVDPSKLIIHWHADILGKPILYPIVRPLEQALLKRSRVIIATSPAYIDYSSSLRQIKDKIVVLPNLVNASTFHEKQEDQERVLQIRETYQGCKIVLFVGRHVEYKGVRYLIEASDYLPENVVVLIAGQGPETADLQARALGKNNVVFLGRISDEERRLYLKASDLFAFPSIDRREAFGVSLLEAFYMGVPAVTFDIPGSGVTWVNQDGETGLVVHERSAKAFAEAMNQILSNPELRDQYSNNAKKWIKENFMCDQIGKHINEIYQ